MRKTLYILLSTLFLFTACQEGNEPNWGDEEDRGIYLAAALSGVAGTRTPYELTIPTPDVPLHSAVWASTTEKKYIDDQKFGNAAPDYTVAVHSEATFRGGEKQLLRHAIYPYNQKPVYFIGLYPYTVNWETNTDGTTASCTFNGKDDVMFAPEVSGTYVSADEVEQRVVKLHYYHLLTWLRIEIVADSETIRNAWGKLKSISIKSRNQVSINLAVTTKPEDNVSFSGATDNLLTFYKTGTDELFSYTGEDEGFTIPAPPPANADEKIDKMDYVEEVAYVLCEPVTATASEEVDGETKSTTEYTLTVQTTERTVWCR